MRLRKTLSVALVEAAMSSREPDKEMSFYKNLFNTTSIKNGLRKNSNTKTSPNEELVAHYSNEYGKPVFEVVLLENIDDNPFNARQIYEEEKIQAMALQLKEEGQLVPGVAIENGKRRTLIAGHYRKQGLKAAGLPTMALMVFKTLPDKMLYTLSYKENTSRNEQTALDNALIWNQLLTKGLFESQESLAEHLGISRATVSRTLKVLELSDAALYIVKTAPSEYSWTTLYELTQLEPLMPSEKFLELLKQAQGNSLSRREILSKRKALSSPKKKGSVFTHKQYDLTSASGNIGRIRSWPNGKVQVEVMIEDPALQEQFLEELKAKFS